MNISIGFALLLITTLSHILIARSNIGGEEGVLNQYGLKKESVFKRNGQYRANAYKNPPNLKDRPAFCTVYECPKFKTICKEKDFEVRSYEPITWAYSEVQSSSKVMAINTAFKRIFRYITGENDKKITIPMSVPVIIKETLPSATAGYWDPQTYRVSFYLQDAYSTDPPTPSNSEVEILKEPEKTYFVYTYTGYMWAFYYSINKYERLKQILADKGVIIESKEYFVAGYDKPTKIFNRHNEIWIEAESNDVARIC